MSGSGELESRALRVEELVGGLVLLELDWLFAAGSDGIAVCVVLDTLGIEMSPVLREGWKMDLTWHD